MITALALGDKSKMSRDLDTSSLLMSSIGSSNTQSIREVLYLSCNLQQSRRQHYFTVNTYVVIVSEEAAQFLTKTNYDS